MNRDKFDFVESEKKVLCIWKNKDCFEEQNKMMEGKPKYVFYDGPPFATGLPHYGHILSGTIKDTVTRFYIQQGFSVRRKFGWDCHGLPVEYEIDKKLNISTRGEILSMGIANYNDECRSIVQKYTSEWEKVVNRMGRWIDFKNGYRTMDISFMESIWYVFSLIYKKNRVYRGFRVMSFSTACSTPLSNFEANLNYKDVDDPSIVVSFKLKKPLRNREIHLAVWTTTPWTLPSNLCVSVHPDFEYVVVSVNEQFYLLLESRMTSYSIFSNAEVVDRIKGAELVGLCYEPPFDYFKEKYPHFFKVLGNVLIKDDSGTGVVHMAPAFGEEDYNLFLKEGLLKENENIPCVVDDKGEFTSTDFCGMYFKHADKPIMKALKEKLLWRGTIRHRYPLCWRSDTPLIYKIVPNWFIRVSDIQEQLYNLNKTIHWVPSPIKTKFGNWLKNARDWSISRNRFWGTPIPIWTNDDYSISVCISSIVELEKRGFRVRNGQRVPVRVTDLHREFLDDIFIEENGVLLHRIDEVFDCWFESGSMPLAQDHWPFSQNEDVEEMLDGLSLHARPPVAADFIAEGLDQTRGWFYTLHVISTLLFKRPAFKNIIVNGIVLASDGKKMSKRLKNYPDPMQIADHYGFDSLRMYLISSPVVEAENLKFTERGVGEVFKNLMINWYNILNFYIENKHKKNVSTGETVLDTWINNRFSTLACSIRNNMEKYKLSSILSDVLVFIDDLSNWYIRMNRTRIRNGEHGVLKNILTKFSIIMAPFTPFFSEYTYQILLGNNNLSDKDFASVHYEMFPQIDPQKPNNFENTKKVIEAIRGLRENTKISLKTPLREAVVIGNEDFDVNMVTSECNILSIKIDSKKNYKYDTRIRPNFSEIKKRTNMADIHKKISQINQIRSIDEIDKHNISIEEIICTEEITFNEKNKIAKNFGEFSIILDTVLGDDLIEMKYAREFFAFLQRLRKKIGLKIDDKVKVYLESDVLKSMVLKNYNVDFVSSISTQKILCSELYRYKEDDVKVMILE